ncbi:MAG TPA: DegT/DnrJ/EryC1/StrS aminotransferase family protein [Gemmataceae bacterium]|nr:DegT/DnrJ/EryC1/StrS aminotransferase family protein [Gemmataceae bacterium]
MNIPLSLPAIGKEEEEAVLQVLRSGWLTHGPKTTEFEQMMANYLGVSHGIAVNSCASALHLALVAHRIRGEVIIPSFTFVATANAVVTAGAKPVFAEVDRATRNLSPKATAAAITPRTEAIMPVHWGGLPCDMGAFSLLAERYGLALIEDSAETVGGTYQGKKAGSYGTGCFSFFPTKNITCGEGGMLTTNNDNVARVARTYAAHGIASTTHARQTAHQPWQRSAVVPGFNMRMSNILAAVGVEQLRKIEVLNEKRRALAARYTQRLGGVRELEIPVEPEGYFHVYQMYTILVPPERRSALITALKGQGINASVHFDPPVHVQNYYRENYPSGSLPVTEELSRSIVTLPLYPDMSSEQVDVVAEAITAFMGEN